MNKENTHCPITDSHRSSTYNVYLQEYTLIWDVFHSIPTLISQQMLFFRPKMIDFRTNLLFLSLKMHKIMHETELSEHFLEFWVWTKWSMKSWNVNSCTNVSKDFKHKLFMENWMIPNIHKIILWVRYWLSKNDQNIVLCMI